MDIKDIINEECIALDTGEFKSVDYFKENILPDEVYITGDAGNYFEMFINGKTYSCNVYDDAVFHHPIAKFKLIKG